MPEKLTAENFLDNLVETITVNVQKQKSVSFFEEETSSLVTARSNRLFGRQKPVHHLLGSGKSADVFFWRNKISSSIVTCATAIWVLFEWIDYNFLTIVCFALALGMLSLLFWVNISALFNRSPSKVPRFVLPPEVFANIGVAVGAKLNEALGLLQDIACGGKLKQLLVVVASLWVAAVIGSWFTF